MGNRRVTAFRALFGLTVLSATPALVSAVPSPCDQGLSRTIPHRPSAAPTGSEFAAQVAGVNEDDREIAILGQLLTGNIPEFLRHLLPITFHGQSPSGQTAEVTLCVAPDYLAVGNDRDFLFVPMRLGTALTVASRYRFILPTRKIVDAIYEQARVHLTPQPLPPGDTMRTTGYYLRHNALVQEQRAGFDAPLGMLTAGDKKDLVLTNRLWDHLERVAIYGWHRPDGTAIQPLSVYHGARYADYSHGVRLVSAVAYVNSQPVSLYGILQDSRLAPLLSDEGAIVHPADLVNVLRAEKSAAALEPSHPMDQLGSSVLQQRNPR